MDILLRRLHIFLSILDDVGYIRKEVIKGTSSLINERIRGLIWQKKKLKHEILKAKFDYAIEELLLLDENIRKME